MDTLLLPGLWIAMNLGLSPETTEYQIVLWAINAPIYIFLVRSVFVIAGRAAGFYHPGQYWYWPRLPWRSLVLALIFIHIWFERVFLMGKRATGGFTGTLGTLARLYRPRKILLGRAYAFGFGLLQPVGVKVERHLFMYAMTGAGKTTTLITMISTWVNSVFVIDPKAQITNALFRHDWRTWYVFDPYGISDAVSASFNVFDCIKAAMSRHGVNAAVLWATRIAQALIITPYGSRSPFFTDTARGFLVGVILHVLSAHSEKDHNLPFVRDLIVIGYRVTDDDGSELAEGKDAQTLLLRMMQKNPAFNGAIAGAAATIASASGDTGGNVRATLQEQTKWLDIPAIREHLLETSFPLSDLKTRKDIIFSVTAPVLSIREELSPACRLLNNMIAYTFEDVKKKNGQCLTVIDELPSQGHNETFEVMLAVARSYGQTVLAIAQNRELMRKAYPQSYGIFSGEADAVFWMASNHDETAAHLSQILGKKSIVEKDRYSGRKFYREVPVMDPDQVKRFLSPDSGNLIVTRAGTRALRLKYEPYFKALPIWCYAADPEHRETLLRKITRFFLGRKHLASKSLPEEKPVEITENIEPISDEPEIGANIIQFPKQPKGDKA